MTAREQKKWLLDEIAKAIKTAPVEHDEPAGLKEWNKRYYSLARLAKNKRTRLPIHRQILKWLYRESVQSSKNYMPMFQSVVFDVPDGPTYRIINSKKALTAFRKKVEKYPTTPAKHYVPERQPFMTNPTSIPKVPSRRPTGDYAKHLVVHAAMDAKTALTARREVLSQVHCEDGEMTATDGRRLSVVLDTGVSEATIHHVHKWNKDLMLVETEIGEYPSYWQAVPGYKCGQLPNIPEHWDCAETDTAKLHRACSQVLGAIGTKEDTEIATVTLFKMPDGSIALGGKTEVDVAGKKEIVRAEPSLLEQGEAITVLNAEYVRDAIGFLMKMGNSRVLVYWEPCEKVRMPIVAMGDREYSVIMPYRGNPYEPVERVPSGLREGEGLCAGDAGGQEKMLTSILPRKD
jgi:hypothetical protein